MTTLQQALDMTAIIYQQKLSDRVTVYLGNQFIDQMGTHTQFLSLVIVDQPRRFAPHCELPEPRWIVLRLSTMRKVIKFLGKHTLLEARRLTDVEKMLCKKSKAEAK